MDSNRDNYRFHFVVYGFYSGDVIHFGIDNEIPLNDMNRYVFNDETGDWIAMDSDLEDVDYNIFLELMNRLEKKEDNSNVN